MMGVLTEHYQSGREPNVNNFRRMTLSFITIKGNIYVNCRKSYNSDGIIARLQLRKRQLIHLT